MDIITQLTAFATKLEGQGHAALANDVKIAAATFVKVAKEIGPQGYAVQNGRCWAGCYRSKRASRPKTSAQDIWFECQEEYEKAIAGDSSDWNKYAGSDVTIKTASEAFSKAVRTMVASGDDVGTAVFNVISSDVFDANSQSIAASESLIRISEQLESKDLLLSAEAAELGGKMVEAWGFGGVKNMLAPQMNKMRGNYKNVSNLSVLKTHVGQLKNTLQGYLQQKKLLWTALQQNKAAIPPAVYSAFEKGLKHLSIQTLGEMDAAVTKAMNSPQVQAPGASKVDPKFNQYGPNKGKPQPAAPAPQSPPPPSDATIPLDKNKNGIPDNQEAKGKLNPDGTIPLRPEEPEVAHDSKTFLSDLGSIPDAAWSNGLMQQAINILNTAKNMRHASRRLFTLLKMANLDADPLNEMIGGGTAVLPNPAKPNGANTAVKAEPAAVKVKTEKPVATPGPGKKLQDQANALMPQQVNLSRNDFAKQFNSLSPEAQQYVMKSLSTLVSKAKADHEAFTNQWNESVHGGQDRGLDASAKKSVFKLA